MSSGLPPVIDVTLTDPTAIVHAVADRLAGRRVEMCWADDLDGDEDLRVSQATVEIIGCGTVDGDGDRVLLKGVPDADDEFVCIPWNGILAVERAIAGDHPLRVFKRVIQASRWFGHQLEVTPVDADRLIGVVTGFDLKPGPSDHVSIGLTPTDHMRHPDMNWEYAIALDDIDEVINWGT